MTMANTAFCIFHACFIIGIITLSSSQVSGFDSPCNIPSRFWCENEEVALKCGVLDQCKKYERTPLAKDAPLVQIGLYYESLCPDCKDFITQQLYPTFMKLSSIMNVTLVPYGNAEEKQVGDHWEFDCQHGKEECEGNIIETCTIFLMKDIMKYFPFINCVEGAPYEEPPKTSAKKCAQKFTVPLKEILNCSTSPLGNQLEHQMAVKTDALKPTHMFVPWITLNGVHTDKIQREAENNLAKLVCDTYKGAKPSGCSMETERILRHHKMSIFERQP